MRIQAKFVVEAFRQIGFKPMRNSYCHQRDKACCGLSAIYRVAFPAKAFNATDVDQWASRALGEEYRFGFVVGFDGLSKDMVKKYGTLAIRGYVDGQAAWKACMDAGLREWCRAWS